MDVSLFGKLSREPRETWRDPLTERTLVFVQTGTGEEVKEVVWRTGEVTTTGGPSILL